MWNFGKILPEKHETKVPDANGQEPTVTCSYTTKKVGKQFNAINWYYCWFVNLNSKLTKLYYNVQYLCTLKLRIIF